MATETRVFCSRKHIEVKLFGISLVFIANDQPREGAMLRARRQHII